MQHLESRTALVPESIRQEQVDDFHNDMETIRQMYHKWRGRDLRKEDARFVLPNACTSEIVVSANLREWRHILKLRISSKAQWEIRKACQQILLILKELAPACFRDIAPSENQSKL
jgi:thymidylate synthase (FAD)